MTRGPLHKRGLARLRTGRGRGASSKQRTGNPRAHVPSDRGAALAVDITNKMKEDHIFRACEAIKTKS